MFLTRHQTPDGPRWALDGNLLPRGLHLTALLALPQAALVGLLKALPASAAATGELLPPIEATQEVWGSGVTYLRSREARKAESVTADVYQRVYEAERPEIFFKQIGWRAVGHGQAVRIRKDTRWNVPEPELTLVINGHQEIVGYTVGNDMSSRDIEGENPLYLPQAKTYTGSCAIGPGIQIAEAGTMTNLAIQLQIARGGANAFTNRIRHIHIRRFVVDQPPRHHDVRRLGERRPHEPLLRARPAAQPLRAHEIQHVDPARPHRHERARFVVRGDELTLARLNAHCHLVLAGLRRCVPQHDRRRAAFDARIDLRRVDGLHAIRGFP